MERAVKGSKVEANDVRATPGWERTRVQIDAGAVDTVGPRKIARTLEIKETAMSKNGVGYIAADGSNINNYEDKKVVDYTDDGEGEGLRIQRADVRKALGSAHKMDVGGNVVYRIGR